MARSSRSQLSTSSRVCGVATIKAISEMRMHANRLVSHIVVITTTTTTTSMHHNYYDSIRCGRAVCGGYIYSCGPVGYYCGRPTEAAHNDAVFIVYWLQLSARTSAAYARLNLERDRRVATAVLFELLLLH